MNLLDRFLTDPLNYHQLSNPLTTTKTESITDNGLHIKYLTCEERINHIGEIYTVNQSRNENYELDQTRLGPVIHGFSTDRAHTCSFFLDRTDARFIPEPEYLASKIGSYIPVSQILKDLEGSDLFKHWPAAPSLFTSPTYHRDLALAFINATGIKDLAQLLFDQVRKDLIKNLAVATLPAINLAYAFYRKLGVIDWVIPLLSNRLPDERTPIYQLIDAMDEATARRMVRYEAMEIGEILAEIKNQGFDARHHNHPLTASTPRELSEALNPLEEMDRYGQFQLMNRQEFEEFKNSKYYNLVTHLESVEDLKMYWQTETLAQRFDEEAAGYRWVRRTTAQEAQSDGAFMKNCIGNYAYRIEKREGLLFALYKDHQHIAEIGIMRAGSKKPFIDQIKAKENSTAPNEDAVRAYAQEVINAHVENLT